MGTYIPTALEGRAFELASITFTEKFKESHTALALQTAIDCGGNEIWVAGYDGYPNSMEVRERDLFVENDYLFQMAQGAGCIIKSTTPTAYTSIQTNSLYQSL